MDIIYVAGCIATIVLCLRRTLVLYIFMQQRATPNTNSNSLIMHTTMIQLASTKADIEKCCEVIKVLRPHLEDDNTIIEMITGMFTEGYQLAFVEEDGKAAAFIGFRYVQYLYNGRHFYIDDLATLPGYRGKGYAGQLLDYVAALSKEKGFKVLTLDSGFLRHDAHRLYLNKGFVMVAHHFSKTL
ncbi:hypothetical protein BH11BAC6_BH11BAC6_01130 [soil metagenome]